jgi:hypothetical protein
MVLILLSLFATGESAYKVVVNPLDFQVEDNPATHFAGLHQLESNGEHLFLLCRKEPAIIEITGDGTFIRRIGKQGNGPGELGYHHAWAMAVSGPSVWVLRGDLTFLNYYEHGDHRADFRPKSYQFIAPTGASNRFASDNEQILVQAHPSTGTLAFVYDYGGNIIKKVGKTFRVDKAYLAVNPALFTTLWEKDGDDWYCLFAHRPILRKYNKNFEKTAEFFIDGPEIHVFETRYAENERDPNFTYPRPHFKDFKVFGDYLYLMSDSTLYQVCKETGKTLSRTIFIGNDEVRAKGGKGKIYFDHFAFLDDGTLVVANPTALYDHDLWTTKLPFLKKIKVKTE